MPHDRDEVTARALVPYGWQAETAQTEDGPSVLAHLSSRCAGDLRDCIADALRAAREEGRQEAQQRTDLMAGATEYAAGFEAGRIEGAREMRETVVKVAADSRAGGGFEMFEAGWMGAARNIAAAIRALPLPGEERQCAQF